VAFAGTGTAALAADPTLSTPIVTISAHAPKRTSAVPAATFRGRLIFVAQLESFTCESLLAAWSTLDDRVDPCPLPGRRVPQHVGTDPQIRAFGRTAGRPTALPEPACRCGNCRSAQFGVHTRGAVNRGRPSSVLVAMRSSLSHCERAAVVGDHVGCVPMPHRHAPHTDHLTASFDGRTSERGVRSLVVVVVV
jgi:hypothetical protein